MSIFIVFIVGGGTLVGVYFENIKIQWYIHKLDSKDERERAWAFQRLYELAKRNPDDERFKGFYGHQFSFMQVSISMSNHLLLERAFYKKDAVAVRVLLRNDYEPPNPPHGPWTLLHWASSIGREDIAEILIMAGADVNAKDGAGWTPLHFAAEHNSEAVATLLLKNGAQVNSKDNYGRIPLHNAGRQYVDAKVAALLLKNGANVNAKDKRECTPLHFAAGNSNKSAAELLLKKGAHVNAKDSRGKTPLDYVVRYRLPAFTALLRNHGGKTRAELKAEANPQKANK